MNDHPFTTLRLDEVEGVPIGEHGLVWKPVRRNLGIRAFGMNAYTAAEEGQEVVEDHDETGGGGAGGHEEVYFVVAGRALFTVGSAEVDAPAGTFVFVRDPTVRRHAVAREPGTTVVAAGGVPGEAYEVSPWEYTFSALPHFRSGDVERGIEILEDGLREHPDNWSLLYNLACYEAVAGRRDPALEHLRAAVARDEEAREYARDDEDFASLRGDPAFAAILAG